MSVSTEPLLLRGKIVRWVAESNWGIANYYVNGDSSPRKVFVHISKVVSVEQPALGSRIEFEIGPGRTSSELPQALRIKVILSQMEVL